MLCFEDCICFLWWWMAEKRRFSNVYFYFFVSCLWFVWWKNCLNSDNQRCVLPLSHNFFCHIDWKDIKSCAALLFQTQNISIVNHCGRSSKAKWAAWIFHEIHRNSFFLSGTCALNFLKSDGPFNLRRKMGLCQSHCWRRGDLHTMESTLICSAWLCTVVLLNLESMETHAACSLYLIFCILN